MKKRLLAGMIALCMVVSLIPTTVFAAETCTKADTCEAETHEAECPKYSAPAVKCTKSDDCAAETHAEGCEKYVAVCLGTKTPEDTECKAETHVEGCEKYVAVCLGAETPEGKECEAQTHVVGCSLYKAPKCDAKDGCTLDKGHEGACNICVNDCILKGTTHEKCELPTNCIKLEGCVREYNHEGDCNVCVNDCIFKGTPHEKCELPTNCTTEGCILEYNHTGNHKTAETVTGNIEAKPVAFSLKTAVLAAQSEETEVHCSTTKEAQSAIDNAQEGTIVILKKGDYETLYIRNNGTEINRIIKNVTIKAEKGATVNVAQIAGQNITGKNLDVENLTIDGLNFNVVNKTGVFFDTNADGTLRVNGLTIQNCSKTGDNVNRDSGGYDCGAFVGLFYDDTPVLGAKYAGNTTLTRGYHAIKILNNRVTSIYQPIKFPNPGPLYGLTVKGNTFTSCKDNNLMLSTRTTEKVVISNNIFDKINGRAMRIDNAAIDAGFTIENNKITNPVGYDTGGDGSVAKITGASGFKVEESNNQWVTGSFDENNATWIAKGKVYVAQNNNTKIQYETLQEAIDTAGTTETTIKLLANITENITIAEGQSITLNIANYTLSGGSVFTNGKKAAIENKGILTVTGMSNAKHGIIRREDDDTNLSESNSYYVIDNQGTMSLKYIDVINNSGVQEGKDGSSLIRVGEVNNKNASLKVTFSKLTQQNFNVIKNYGTTTTNSTVIIESKNNRLNYAILSYGKLTTSSGTTVYGPVCIRGYKEGDKDFHGIVNFTATSIYGNITVEQDTRNPSAEKPSMTLVGPTTKISGTIETGTWNGTDFVKDNIPNTSGTVVLNGGNYTVRPSDAFLADGKIIFLSTEEGYTYKVDSPTAKIDDVVYASFSEAIEAAHDEDVIELLSDIKGCTINKKVIVDLNGHTINTNKTSYLKVTSGATIKNGTITGSASQNGMLQINASNISVEINNCTFNTEKSVNGIWVRENLDNVSVVLNSTSISTGGNFALVVNGESTNVNTTLNNCILSGAKYGIYYPATGKLIVNGSSISGRATGIENRGANIIIKGNAVITGGTEEFSYEWNGGGTTTSNAAVAVVPYNNRNMDVQIENGTFNGNKALYINIDQDKVTNWDLTTTITNGEFNNGVKKEGGISVLEISGGKYKENPITDYLKIGYETKKNGNYYEVGEHKLVPVAKVEPKCESTGVAAHYKCEFCGNLYSDAAGTTEVTVESLLIPATGNHSYGNWTVTKAATCGAKGTEQRVCSVCGKTETRDVAATGNHSYGAWKLSSKPTCTSAGSNVSVCSVCGHERYSSIAKTSHSYGSNGKCTVCGDYDATKVAAPVEVIPAPTTPATTTATKPATTQTTTTTTENETTTAPVENAKPETADTTITKVEASVEVVEAVKETVKVEEGTAKVETETIEKVIEATEEGKEVVLPLTQVTEEVVNKAEVPAEALEKIAEKETDVVIQLTEITVKLDAAAVAAVAEQAQGKNIEIRAVQTETVTLTEKQQEALADKETAIVVTAQIFADGEYIGDFKGGTATVMLPFTPEEGKAAEDYKVYFIDDDGSLTEVAAEYVDGHMVFTTGHFSDYAIVYEKAESVEEGDSEAEVVITPEEEVSEGTSLPIIPIVVVIAIIVIVGIVLVMRKKNEEE